MHWYNFQDNNIMTGTFSPSTFSGVGLLYIGNKERVVVLLKVNALLL